MPGGTGFFGKVPGAGDFVARGLAPGVRQVLDKFLTTHLAPAARHPRLWPEGGLRALIAGPQGPLLLCIVPSLDAAGRTYPVAACVGAGGAGRAEADRWCDAVLDALWHEDEVEALAAALSDVPTPGAGEVALEPPLMWLEGHAAGAPDVVAAGVFGGPTLETGPR